MTRKELIRIAIERDMRLHLKKAFLKYGIEGTEDKLKDIYKNMPVILEKYLTLYNKIVRK